MCGILGIYNLDDKGVDEQLLQAMGQEIAHRGPDGEGIHIDGNLGFVHKRLAILDP